MSESKQNIMSVLSKNAPRVQGNIGAGIMCKQMLRPGVSVFLHSADHRKHEGRHQALDLKTNEWIEMGPGIKDEDVWIVEEKGDPGPEIWCWGFFGVVQLSDSVAVNGKKRVATLQTSHLLFTVSCEEIKGLERALLYGDGQSAILSQ